jgi:arylsulfatase A-like enzyme
MSHLPVDPPTISRRDVLASAAAAGLVAGFAPLARAAEAANAAKPNIIWLMADDLGFADTGITGLRGLATPNIDRIAKEGLFLRQSYSNSAVCSATRTGLITGRYQYRLRVGLDEPLGANPDVGLPPEHPTLPSLLRKAGYRTTLVGKWHLGDGGSFGPLHSGYDRFYGILKGGTDYFRHGAGQLVDGIGSSLLDGEKPAGDIGYLTDLLAKRAVSEIDAANADRVPLFLSLHFTAPHWPWEGPEDKAVSDSLKSLYHRDGGSVATYHKMIASLDAAIGQVLARLDHLGTARNTIVIFTSDNGGERYSDTWPFTGVKTELLEGGIRVPFFIRWPGHIAAGSRSEQVNISMDWVPTLLAAAGGAPDPAYPPDGQDLLDVVTGKAPPRPRQLFFRYKAAEQAAFRDGDWKYLKLGKAEWLFNLAEDERERANYAQREPARFAAMKQGWAAWNATMLPYPDNATSAGNVAADRY